MSRITEIRINNYVYVKAPESDKFKMVVWLNKDYMRLIMLDKIDFKFITVSKMWLRKFKFREKKDGLKSYFSKAIIRKTGEAPELYIFYHFFQERLIEYGICSTEIERDNKWYEAERAYFPKIRYVHRLQNLIQDLNGKIIK